MNTDILRTSILDELDKIAATRSVREWRSASGAGNQAYADQIAQASGQLGLKPRYLENVSGGGMEAAVDKMMGSAGGANQSGYVAQKIYKPDSPIATGENMSQLLQTKKQMTDTARGLSPEAKAMVPEMYGHKTIQGPGGQMRHVSQHEYVPGLQSMKHYSTNAGDIENVNKMQRTVAGPMAAKGTPMRDVPRLAMHGGQVQVGGNASNMGMSPQGPKVIDFLPEGMSSSSSPGSMGVMQKGRDDVAFSQLGSGRTDTAYGKQNLNQLRKDVYRPQANYQPPSLAPPPPRATSLPPAASQAPTAMARPSAAMAPTVRPTAAGTLATKAVGSAVPQAATQATKATSMAGKAVSGIRPSVAPVASAATRMTNVAKPLASNIRNLATAVGRIR